LWVALDWGPKFWGLGVVVRGARQRRLGTSVCVKWHTGPLAKPTYTSPRCEVAVRLDQCRPATPAETAAGVEAQLCAISDGALA